MKLQNYLQQNPLWKDTGKLIFRFRPKTNWASLNQSFIRSFKNWMLNTATKKDGSNYSVNTFLQHYKILRIAINSAINEDIKGANTKCFGLKFKKEKSQHIFLTKFELERLESVELNERDNIIRKMFLIGAYSGARYSDFKDLSVKNIQQGTIRYMCQKTGERIAVPAHKYIIGVLENGVPDLIGLSEMSARVVFDRRIKRICQKAGICSETLVSSKKGGLVLSETKEKWQMVSSHTARRSFASNLVLAGASVYSVSKLLGHSNITITEGYILCDLESVVGEVSGLECWG